MLLVFTPAWISSLVFEVMVAIYLESWPGSVSSCSDQKSWHPVLRWLSALRVPPAAVRPGKRPDSARLFALAVQAQGSSAPAPNDKAKTLPVTLNPFLCSAALRKVIKKAAQTYLHSFSNLLPLLLQILQIGFPALELVNFLKVYIYPKLFWQKWTALQNLKSCVCVCLSSKQLLEPANKSAKAII